MDFLLGLGTFAVASILLSLAYGAHRRPNPAYWTQVPGLSMLVCVALTLMAPVAIGFFVKEAISPMQEFASLSFLSVIVTAALVALAFVASPILIRPALRRSNAVDQPVADNRNTAPSLDAAIAA